MKTTRLYFNGALNCGAFIQGASVEVSEDYTMTEVVNAIKEKGYCSFMLLDSMRRLVRV